MKKSFATAILVSLCTTSAFAKEKADLKQFVGDFNLVSSSATGNCPKDIGVIATCDGLKVQAIYGEKQRSNQWSFCSVDKGTKRDVSRGSVGHIGLPELEITKVTVTSNPKERKLTKVESSTSVSIGVYSADFETSIQMENENQMTVQVRDNNDTEEGFEMSCTYMRK